MATSITSAAPPNSRRSCGVQIEGPHIADKFLMDGVEKQARATASKGCATRPPTAGWKRARRSTIGGHDFEIFHCPGHSPGSLVYVNRAQQFALVGDVIFRGSIGRTDFPYGDHDALIRAIKTKLFPLGDDIAFICGHGGMGSFGMERQSNPFLV